MKKHTILILSLACIAMSVIGCEVEVPPNCPVKGEYRCVDKDTGQPVSGDDVKCLLKVCEGGDWIVERECEYGYHEGDDFCLKNCEDGSFRCMVCQDASCERTEYVEHADGACTLYECVSNTWQRQDECRFGYDGGKHCVNPCSLRGNHNNIYDNAQNTLLGCDDNGWTLANNKCDNDITLEELIETDQNDFNETLIRYANKNDKELLNKLTDETIKHEYYYASCGNCKNGIYSNRCLETNSSSLLYKCENGTKIEGQPVSDCSEYHPNVCEYDDSKIYVDFNTNIDHCGGCNTPCLSGTVCKNGTCKSISDCDNGYTDHPDKPGIKARCIDSYDSIKQIRDEINASIEDNNNPYKYYILVKDIVIDEPWTPIGTADNPFEGTFNGNNKTITIKNKFISDQESSQQTLGLFGHVQYSTFEENKNKTIISDLNLIFDNKESMEGDSFGLLAGKADYTDFNNIIVKTGEQPVIGTFHSTGGLVGEAINCKFINDEIQKFHFVSPSVDITSNNIGCLLGIGSNNIIDSNTIKNCEITGHDSIGGLIGNSSDNIVTSNTVSNSSFSGNENIGGLIGLDTAKSIIDRSSASFKTLSGNSYLGGLIGKFDDTIKLTHSYSEGRITGINYIGGLIGYGKSNPFITLTHCSSYNFIDIQTSSSTQYVGGLIGKYDCSKKLDDFAFMQLNTIHHFNYSQDNNNTKRVGDMFGFLDLKRKGITRIHFNAKRLYSIASSTQLNSQDIFKYLIGRIDVNGDDGKVKCKNDNIYYMSTESKRYGFLSISFYRFFSIDDSTSSTCEDNTKRTSIKDLPDKMTSALRTVACRTADFKKAIGCVEGEDECDNLIKLLCGGDSTECETFRIPVPYSAANTDANESEYIVLPSFCDDPSKSKD